MNNKILPFQRPIVFVNFFGYLIDDFSSERQIRLKGHLYVHHTCYWSPNLIGLVAVVDKSRDNASPGNVSRNAFLSLGSDKRLLLTVKLWWKHKLNLVEHGLYSYRWHYASSQWSKLIVDSLGCTTWVHNTLITFMRCIVVKKITDHAKPHLICYNTSY